MEKILHIKTFLKMEEWKEVFWGCGISERELVVVPSDTSPLAPLNQKLFIIRKEYWKKIFKTAVSPFGISLTPFPVDLIS